MHQYPLLQIPPPASLRDAETHFSGVTFASPSHFAVQWMDRTQGKTVLALCTVGDIKDCAEIFQHEEDKGWVDYKYEVHFDPRWKPDSGTVPRFVTLLSDPHTEHRYPQVGRTRLSCRNGCK